MRGLPEELEDLPWEPPRTFLGLDEEHGSFDGSEAVILPVPYEATTSWGGGTREGPRAILDASHYVELHDHELGTEPYRRGIHTLPALELSRAGPADALAELEEAYGRILEAAGDRFICVLGGEHSITAAPVRVHARRTEGPLTVLQLDAHADLRAGYGGTEHSHASVMRRVADEVEIVGVGIRGISPEEAEFAASRESITHLHGEELWEDDIWMDRALGALDGRVYLTFDVDFLDPSLVPSTGTPEPGGGLWHPTLRFLRRVFREREVVGLDVVEHAPIPGVRAPDFLVAKLVYKLIAYHGSG